jgi:flagellar assembly protein FliH
MTNMSSRVLREAEQAAVTPITWRAAAFTLSPKGRTSPIEVQEVPSDQAAFERDQNGQQERDRIEREAYHRGFTEGKTVGQQQAGAELQSVLDQLGRSLATLSSLRSRIRGEAEGDLLKLAISIARRVLHRELTLDPESMEGLIRVALDKLQSRELCRVRVHPDQEQAIRKSLDRFSNSQKVELIADSSLQCGDVLFETAHGNLDASIESQLGEIERGLADRLRRLPQNRQPQNR